MNQKTSADANAIKSLANKLRQAPRVTRLAAANSTTADDVATEAATGLLDIQRSSDVLFNVLLPRLNSLAPESPDLAEVLDDIAEEYRHMYYHIANTKLFSYVVPGK